MMHGHGANYNDYQKAFSSVKRTSSVIIPSSGLSDNKSIAIRNAGEQLIVQPSSLDEKRNMGNIMMAVNNYSYLTCQCGLKIKIPPGFGTNKPEIICPKCGTINKVSFAKQIQN
jgi:heat shock protein HtpX